jgi:hypothetical protein
MPPTREIYWNIVNGALIYILALVAASVTAGNFAMRIPVWRISSSSTGSWPSSLPRR